MEEVKCPARLKPCLSNYKGCPSHTLCCLSAECGNLWCIYDTRDTRFLSFPTVKNMCSLFHFHMYWFSDSLSKVEFLHAKSECDSHLRNQNHVGSLRQDGVIERALSKSQSGVLSQLCVTLGKPLNLSGPQVRPLNYLRSLPPLTFKTNI